MIRTHCRSLDIMLQSKPCKYHFKNILLWLEKAGRPFYEVMDTFVLYHNRTV